jgi:hypothetical protein
MSLLGLLYLLGSVPEYWITRVQILLVVANFDNF